MKDALLIFQGRGEAVYLPAQGSSVDCHCARRVVKETRAVLLPVPLRRAVARQITSQRGSGAFGFPECSVLTEVSGHFPGGLCSDREDRRKSSECDPRARVESHGKSYAVWLPRR